MDLQPGQFMDPSDIRNSCISLDVEKEQGTWVVLEFKSYLLLLNLPLKPDRENKPTQEQAVLKGKNIYSI